MKLRIYQEDGKYYIEKRHWYRGWETIDFYYTREMAELVMERMLK